MTGNANGTLASPDLTAFRRRLLPGCRKRDLWNNSSEYAVQIRLEILNPYLSEMKSRVRSPRKCRSSGIPHESWLHLLMSLAISLVRNISFPPGRRRELAVLNNPSKEGICENT